MTKIIAHGWTLVIALPKTGKVEFQELLYQASVVPIELRYLLS
jgi:hypothetical protein